MKRNGLPYLFSGTAEYVESYKSLQRYKNSSRDTSLNWDDEVRFIWVFSFCNVGRERKTTGHVHQQLKTWLVEIYSAATYKTLSYLLNETYSSSKNKIEKVQ